jgi:ATP-dependent DNA ligase
MGLEGVIAKKVNAPYRSARSDAWLKVKCELRQEFVIGGFVTRTGSPREIGSLLLGVYDDEGRLALGRQRRHRVGLRCGRGDVQDTPGAGGPSFRV